MGSFRGGANKLEPVASKLEPVASKLEPVANKLEPVANKLEPVANKLCGCPPAPVAAFGSWPFSRSRDWNQVAEQAGTSSASKLEPGVANKLEPVDPPCPPLPLAPAGLSLRTSWNHRRNRAASVAPSSPMRLRADGAGAAPWSCRASHVVAGGLRSERLPEAA